MAAVRKLRSRSSLLSLSSPAIVLVILFFCVHLGESAAAPTIPWPPSKTDPTTLKCLGDTTRPECRTYKQLQAVYAERQARESNDARTPRLLNNQLPSIPVPVLVPPPRTTTTALPSITPATTPDDSSGRTLTKRLSKPIKVLVIGDSISHGREGDWTWRYRIWSWLKNNGVRIQFVGPYPGTKDAAVAKLPPFPTVPGDPQPTTSLLINGGYAAAAPSAYRTGVATHQHSAYFGRWAADFLTTYPIQSLVATYQPDYVFALVGFNDILLATTPSALLNTTSQIVNLARQAKPNVKFAISTVPRSAALPTLDYVANNTDTYNAQLPDALMSLNTTSSPIAFVNLTDTYTCQPSSCPASYDGIVHPNSLGEFQIAQAFSIALRRTFNLGKRDFLVPTNPPLRNTPIPSNVNASGSGSGVTVTWDPVYGAYGYDVRSRQAGQANWTQSSVLANRFDSTWTFAGQQFQYQVRTNNGDIISDWSDVANATAAPQLASAPSNITIQSTPGGFTASWLPPTGNYSDSVNLYQILWVDMDVPGSFLGGTASRGQSASITGLTPGHRYGTFFTSWNANGGGLPGGARPVTVGGGTPAAPSNLTVTATNALTVQLQWCGDPMASGYRIWLRNAARNETLRVLDNINSYVTSATLGYLFPGTWNYEFCVSAINGNSESTVGNCVRAGTPADGQQGGTVGGAGCYNGKVPGDGSTTTTTSTTSTTTSSTTLTTSTTPSSTTDTLTSSTTDTTIALTTTTTTTIPPIETAVPT